MENTQPQTPSSLQAGFAKVNITPDFSVGIGGYSNAETRRSERVEAPIYATCIALADGGETVLLYTIGYRPVRDCGGQIGIYRADARMDNVQLTIENCGISFGNHLKSSP